MQFQVLPADLEVRLHTVLQEPLVLVMAQEISHLKGIGDDCSASFELGLTNVELVPS